MTITLQRSSKLAILIFGAIVLTAAFSGTAHAQTATAATDCPSVCAPGTTCYHVTNSTGAMAKRCLTPTEFTTANAVPSSTGGNNSAGGSSGTTLVNPLKVDSLEALLDLVLTAVIRIGTIILVLMLVWVGFLFVTARGNEEKIRDARRALVWTVIGGLILLGAKGLSAVIQSTANAL